MDSDKPQIKKHTKEDYEIKCPNCGQDDISEIIGWCYNHHNPIFDGDRRFCTKPEECGFISEIKDAFFCNQCDTMYDKDNMTNWNWSNTGYGNCPVGKEISEESPKEYADKLIHFILDYQEDRIDECLEKEYYIEAIVYLHRQIFEELRHLLLKKVKGDNNIPLEESDPKYKQVVPFLKNMTDDTLRRMAFIYGRINKPESGDIRALNTLRNQFVHAWNSKERERRSDQEIKNILEKVKIIERRLNIECKKYGIVDAL